MNLNEKRAPELVPSKNLASAFVSTKLGKDYLGAMNAAINFAFANRQLMAHKFRQVFTKYVKERGLKAKVEQAYDVAHNSAKWEMHRGKKVLVHRKGATRALPPGHEDNPKAYSQVGHPAIVPGTMGTASFVLVGIDKAEETYYSVNHGAGRAMSRTEAKSKITKSEFEKQMEGVVFNKPYKVVADEAPGAYKDVLEVVSCLTDIGITKKVAKLTPLAVIKGD
jgi:tRNA-splicing ligase RtcB